jgi:hypothetical protein
MKTAFLIITVFYLIHEIIRIVIGKSLTKDIEDLQLYPSSKWSEVIGKHGMKHPLRFSITYITTIFLFVYFLLGLYTAIWYIYAPIFAINVIASWWIGPRSIQYLAIFNTIAIFGALILYLLR